MHINYLEEFKRNKTGLAGAALLALIILGAVFGPLLSPYSPHGTSVLTLSPPSPAHWLGTNDVGQDIFTRLLYGARTSLAVAAGTALLTTFLALVVGTSAALAGGVVDKILMRLTDALLTLPVVIVVVMVAAYLRPGIVTLVLTLAVLGWPVGARIIRAQALSLKERSHVYAARAFGGGGLYITLHHLVPDLLPLLCVSFIQGARRAVFLEAGLAFLGVVDPALTSWGTMLRHALDYCFLAAYKWWLLPTGAALSLTILSFTLVGYSLEEITDPRLRRHADVGNT